MFLQVFCMPAATFLHCDALDNHAVSCYNRFCFGGVSERFKEAVLKTVELLPGSVGSNPTLSVSFIIQNFLRFFQKKSGHFFSRMIY